MPIRKPKPTSPGRRFLSYSDYAEITKTTPERSLVEGLKKSGGRNAHGRKTARHRGGGAKRLYRKIDFKRTRDGVPAKVASIEYDPNRSSYIALLHYVDGVKSYILAPARLRVGMTVQSGIGSDITVGNAMPLSACRSAPRAQRRAAARPRRSARPLGRRRRAADGQGRLHGHAAPAFGRDAMVRAECRATVGTVGNADHQNVTVGKAGRKRHMGVRPQTRGTA
jgi:large subunit ribosomal protein L2